MQYYGAGNDDECTVGVKDIDPKSNHGFVALLDALTIISGKVSHLTFDGPGESANGFRNCDVSRLIYSKSQFNKLKEFRVALTDPGHHNLSCISGVENNYQENELISDRVGFMSGVERLVLPRVS